MKEQDVHTDIEIHKELDIKIGSVTLSGELVIPQDAQGIVLFSHGSGSSRFSPRNNYVARLFNSQKFGTFLFDLLTPDEDKDYNARFNITLLSNRLTGITEQMAENPITRDYPFGYFGASTGAASAL